MLHLPPEDVQDPSQSHGVLRVAYAEAEADYWQASAVEQHVLDLKESFSECSALASSLCGR